MTQGGALRSFCFFALLLSTEVKCTGQNSLNAEDFALGGLQNLLDESDVANELNLRKNSGLQSFEENDLDGNNRNAAALSSATSGINSPLSGLLDPNLVPTSRLSNLPIGGLLRSKYQSPYGGSGYSQAEAEALAQAGAGLLSPGLGLSVADAYALANVLGGGGQSYGSAEAYAKALAQLQSQPLLNAGYPSGVLNSAQAKALAQVLGSSNVLSGAQAQAQTQGGASQSQSQAQSLGGGSAQSQAQSMALGFNPALLDGLVSGGSVPVQTLINALTDARTRVIPAHEYVLPYTIPGGQQILTCSREGELHNVWSPAYECLMCACINQGGFLAPVCASCSRCTVPPVPEPPPVAVATCDPLPTETPFENPLNPCQICVCHLTVDRYGQQDVQIVCQENPDCLARNMRVPKRVPLVEPVVPLNPPVPIKPLHSGPLPGPSPHKSCRPFVPNQPFSHPWDVCQECVCSESQDYGLINVEVNCYTKKECCIEVPQLPERVPSPVPYENVVYIEPRCRLHPPRQPFVVECSVCSCETVYNYVIAKCTKAPHCDVNQLYNGGVLPYNSNPSLHTVSPVIGSHSAADASAYSNVGLSPYFNSGAYGSATADAESNANSGYGYSSALANTNVFGGSGSGLGLLPSSVGGTAQADAFANVNSGLYPSDLSGSSASAAANALSNVGLNVLNSQQFPDLNPAYQSSAIAEANSNVNSGLNPFSYGPSSVAGNSATAQSIANVLSNVNSLNPYLVQTQPNNPSSFSSADAVAEQFANSAAANANALSFVNSPYQPYYDLQPGSETNSGLSPPYYQINPYSWPSYQPSISSGSAGAHANSNVANNPYLSGYQTGSTSSAQADALALSNSGLLGNNYGSANALADAYSSYPYGGSSPYSNAEANALAASNVYSGFSPHVNPLYQQGQGAVSKALAQALANSQGQGSAGAQSQASALSGWPLIKSAPAEGEDNE